MVLRSKIRLLKIEDFNKQGFALVFARVYAKHSIAYFFYPFEAILGFTYTNLGFEGIKEVCEPWLRIDKSLLKSKIRLCIVFLHNFVLLRKT